jgi:hypothetical protein
MKNRKSINKNGVKVRRKASPISFFEDVIVDNSGGDSCQVILKKSVLFFESFTVNFVRLKFKKKKTYHCKVIDIKRQLMIKLEI